MSSAKSLLTRARYAFLLLPIYGAFSSFVQGCTGQILRSGYQAEAGCTESPYGYGYGYEQCENGYGYGSGDCEPCP
jgi:hypothetical protein